MKEVIATDQSLQAEAGETFLGTHGLQAGKSDIYALLAQSGHDLAQDLSGGVVDFDDRIGFDHQEA